MLINLFYVKIGENLTLNYYVNLCFSASYSSLGNLFGFSQQPNKVVSNSPVPRKHLQTNKVKQKKRK